MNFFEDIVTACNKEELDFIFKKQCIELDIHLFSVVHLSEKNEFKSLNSYQKEWLDLYLGNNFFLLDPVYDIINNTYLS
ncbi:MAG: hypothetical protein C0425_10115 [Chlorobiaceae bacterium]|nr:hypothetical protein [Chlorobiaceae bacterium]